MHDDNFYGLGRRSIGHWKVLSSPKVWESEFYFILLVKQDLKSKGQYSGQSAFACLFTNTELLALFPLDTQWLSICSPMWLRRDVLRRFSYMSVSRNSSQHDDQWIPELSKLIAKSSLKSKEKKQDTQFQKVLKILYHFLNLFSFLAIPFSHLKSG